LIFEKRDFPGGHEPLLPFLDAPERRLRLRAANALSRFRHPELRTRALELLAHVDTLEYGLTLLAGNYAPGDYTMLTARLRDPLDDEALHAFGFRVHEMFAHHPAPEAAELLLSLYEQGPCAQCREKFVDDLIVLGALPAHLVEECRFDANEGVRALVAPLGV
jgi:HEAT repeat protein